MKSQTTRRVFALAAAVVLSFSLSAGATPREARDPERGIPTKIVKIIQKIFGITSQDSLPIPPKP